MIKFKKCYCGRRFKPKSNRHKFCRECSKDERLWRKRANNSRFYRKTHPFSKKRITIGSGKPQLGTTTLSGFGSATRNRPLPGGAVTAEDHLRAERGLINETTGEINDYLVDEKRIKQFEAKFSKIDKTAKSKLQRAKDKKWMKDYLKECSK